jgi:hypothetical protein
MTKTKPQHDAWSAALATHDEATAAIEASWGRERLLRLAPPELAQRFRDAAGQLDAAITVGSIELAAQKAAAVARGLAALDAAARKAGHHPDQVEVWTVGEYAVYRHAEDWHPVARLFPNLKPISAEELINLMHATEAGVFATKAKELWPMATVVPAQYDRELNDAVPF